MCQENEEENMCKDQGAAETSWGRVRLSVEKEGQRTGE